MEHLAVRARALLLLETTARRVGPRGLLAHDVPRSSRY